MLIPSCSYGLLGTISKCLLRKLIITILIATDQQQPSPGQSLQSIFFRVNELLQTEFLFSLFVFSGDPYDFSYFWIPKYTKKFVNLAGKFHSIIAGKGARREETGKAF